MARETAAQRYRREEKERKAAVQRELKYLCAFLTQLGVKQVVAKFDGQGDDGEITEFIAQPEPKAGMPAGMAKAIENQLYFFIPPAWEINEGSFGTVKLDVATVNTTCDIEWRPDEYDPDDDDDDEDW